MLRTNRSFVKKPRPNLPVRNMSLQLSSFQECEQGNSRTTADYHLLEGPRSRTGEFVQLLRVLRNFLRGFRVLHFVGPCVTVFGSARIQQNDPYYRLARDMGAALARLGFTVMTGGGPGIMEAANRGAKEAGGRSVGCNTELPFEQKPNA